MDKQDIINELQFIKGKLRDFTHVINRLIKELDHYERLEKFKKKRDSQSPSNANSEEKE